MTGCWQRTYLSKGCFQTVPGGCNFDPELKPNQIHEQTIPLRFLGIILRVLRLEVSVYNFFITNQIQTSFTPGGGGGE
jgi:hypothetical protein